jgi:hypothetical protein
MSSPTSATKIFISYRRAECAVHAGRLSDQLEAHFGSHVVFIDFESIQPGRDFIEAIREEVSSCKILIAIIGQQWLTCSNERGRRLDDPKDYVRMEISAALNQGIRVIPVLVQDAEMPREQDLPDDLAPLARKQAWCVSDLRWKRDVKLLIDKIEKDVTPPRASETLQEVHPSLYGKVGTRHIIATIGALVLLISILGALIYYFSQGISIDNPDIQVVCSDYECNRFSCNLVKGIERKKIVNINVELMVEQPTLKPFIDRQTLQLAPPDTGKPGTQSSYSAVLSYEKGTDVHLLKVVNVLAVNSE